jgi:hypothetical protein
MQFVTTTASAMTWLGDEKRLGDFKVYSGDLKLEQYLVARKVNNDGLRGFCSKNPVRD